MTLPELEAYFSSIDLPSEIRLSCCEYVVDVRKMVETNLAALKAHPGNKCYLPYYKQLIQLKNKISETLDN